MPHYTTFRALIESAVLPLRQKHIGWTRLGGRTSEDSRDVFATFRYQYQTWKIHADTRIDAILAAWELEKAGKQPFEIVETPAGNKCLRLSGRSDEADGLCIYLQ